jgi:glycosyltransferase involved in cell wall biosynthesis
MKKIIYTTTISNTLPWHLKNIIENAVKDFEIYVIGDDVENYSQLFPSIKMINLKIERKPKISSDFIALIKLIVYFLKIKPDVSHSIMPKSGLLASIASRLTLTPIRLHTFTGQVWSNYDGKKRKFYKLIDLIIIKLNTLCLTDSPSQSNYLFLNKIRYKEKPLPVIGKGSLSGVDIKKYNIKSLSNNSHKFKEKLGIKEDDFIFAYIARKTIDKGAIEMIDSFQKLRKKHPKVKLLFVGPSEDNAVIDYLGSNKSLLINVITLEAVSNHFEYLNISDVLCLPSYREGFGTIVIDAAALGKPAIGYKIPGLIDSIVHNKTGILVSEKNTFLFSSAMEKLYLDDNLREKLGQNALARVNEFYSSESIYAGLKIIYNGNYPD